MDQNLIQQFRVQLKQANVARDTEHDLRLNRRAPDQHVGPVSAVLRLPPQRAVQFYGFNAAC
jgi:hypothetical protein